MLSFPLPCENASSKVLDDGKGLASLLVVKIVNVVKIERGN